jgi:hypothetical protein
MLNETGVTVVFTPNCLSCMGVRGLLAAALVASDDKPSKVIPQLFSILTIGAAKLPEHARHRPKSRNVLRY